MGKTSKTFAVFLTLVIAMSCVTLVAKPVNALFAVQHLPQITINKDGSVIPQTAYITQSGNTYTLMADIKSEYFIKIECSNIVFDGMGHSINTTVNGLHIVDGYPASYADPSIYVQTATNVVIQNVSAFTSNVYAVYLLDCSNCSIIGVTTEESDCVAIKGNSNILTKCNGGVCISDGVDNRVFCNNITNMFLGTACQIFRNNFFLSDKPDLWDSSTWDDRYLGNYWCNYTVKYPNASEIDHSGIGDTPYNIDRADYSTREYPDATNIDNHPLFYPYDIDRDTISFPTNTPTPIQLNNSAIDTTIVIAGTVLFLAIVSSLLLLRRHRKTIESKQ
jgi:hypothetical protein